MPENGKCTAFPAPEGDSEWPKRLPTPAQPHAPDRKMEVRFHLLGKAEGVTESLDSAIMAPSLNTASSTMRMVGKYLWRGGRGGCGAVGWGRRGVVCGSWWGERGGVGGECR